MFQSDVKPKQTNKQEVKLVKQNPIHSIQAQLASKLKQYLTLRSDLAYKYLTSRMNLYCINTKVIELSYLGWAHNHPREQLCIIRRECLSADRSVKDPLQV